MTTPIRLYQLRVWDSDEHSWGTVDWAKCDGLTAMALAESLEAVLDAGYDLDVSVHISVADPPTMVS